MLGCAVIDIFLCKDNYFMLNIKPVERKIYRPKAHGGFMSANCRLNASQKRFKISRNRS